LLVFSDRETHNSHRNHSPLLASVCLSSDPEGSDSRNSRARRGLPSPPHSVLPSGPPAAQRTVWPVFLGALAAPQARPAAPGSPGQRSGAGRLLRSAPPKSDRGLECASGLIYGVRIFLLRNSTLFPPPPTSNQKSFLGKNTIRVVFLVQACFPNLPIFYMSVCERLPAIASTCASRVHQGWILSHGAAKKVYGHVFFWYHNNRSN